MNSRVIAFVLFFAALMIAPWLVEPAYYGFLVAFAMLIGVQGEWNGFILNVSVRGSTATILMIGVVLVVIATVLSNGPAARDLFRDCGAVFAFFVGRHLFVAYRDKGLQTEVLTALSIMGVMVAVVTIGAAFMALTAGVSAYIWRGEYVPWAHTWLPYAIVANFFLVSLDKRHARRYAGRTALCVLGTIASLSRTDLLLELFFGLALMYRFRRQLFLHIEGFAKTAVVLAIFVAMVPFMLQLQVVQQRVEAGVGDNDESLGWRFMEHVALLDHFLQGTVYDALFGFGLGARMPLPPGIVDFNDNTSIPHLHNSFATIALKFGALGLLVLAWYLWRTMRRSFALRTLPGEPHRAAGRWIVLLCLGKALTLQGLSEWSHLVFFGIGCMLMLSRPLKVFWLVAAPGNGSAGVTLSPIGDKPLASGGGTR